MADEIVARYRLESDQFVAGAQKIEAETDKLVGDNKKLETSFNQVNKTTAKAFSADSVKNFNKEASKALKDVKKETDNLTNATKGNTNGFLALRKELKGVQGEMAILVSKGRENSKLFKALASEAGVLKDRMKDLGSTIELQAGDPLENLSTGFGQLKNSILNLDFEGVSRSMAGLGANIGKIDLKTFTQGLGGITNGFIKLGAAIITSPLFLIGAAVAGIIAVIANWGESLDDIAARHNKNIDSILANLDRVNAGYERQAKLIESLGQSTYRVEQQRLEANIQANKKAKSEAEKSAAEQLEIIEGLAKARSVLTGRTVEEQLKIEKEGSESYMEAQKKIVQFDEEVLNSRAELQALRNSESKARQDKANEDEKKALDKSNENYKKYLEDRLQLGLKKFNEAVDRERFNEQQQEKADIEASNKKIQEIIDSNYAKTIKKRETIDDYLRGVRRENLENILNDETKSYDDRQAALDYALEKTAITEQEYTQKSRELTLQRIQDKRMEFEATVKLGQDLISIGQSFAEIARNLGMENAEGEKALAVFGVAMNLAQSLGNIILGATEAAAATGPLAPFTLAGYVASGTAAVLAAFAQVSQILTQEPPSFAVGGYTGDGGKYQPAGTVHRGEFVSTQEDTNKYWDELNAIHDGTFDDLLMYKYIEPALNSVMLGAKEAEGLSFAQNVANSMRLNFKSNEMLNALVKSNNDENKRHGQLINTIKRTGSKRIYRKK